MNYRKTKQTNLPTKIEESNSNTTESQIKNEKLNNLQIKPQQKPGNI